MTAPVRTTPMNDEILARTPAGRWGQPEEVAGAAVYLASRASDFVTGDTISSRWRLRYSITRAYAAIIVVKSPSREFALSLRHLMKVRCRS